MPSGYIYLAFAIISEVIATTALKFSLQFTKLIPSIFVLLGYSFAFYFLSLSLKTLSLGIAYAIWCAVGIILITMVGWVLFNESLDIYAIIGIIFLYKAYGFTQSFSNYKEYSC